MYFKKRRQRVCDRRKFYFLNRVRNKKNCAEHAWIKYFNVQKYIFLSNNTPDLVKFPIPMNASFVNLYFHRAPHRVKYRGEEEEEEKEEERDVEDGWPATIFLTRGERFDQRLAEGILFHPPAPGVFCRLRYLSSLFLTLCPPFCNFPHLPFIVSRRFFAKRRSTPSL